MDDQHVSIGVGDAAPDVYLKQEDGQETALSNFWRTRPAVLVFVRHFG